ncbi:MAG: hypothetical protein WCE30_10170 [Mycobacterium sp.]
MKRFNLEVLLKLASGCAAAIYAVLFVCYRRYYHELGITPEDIGVGSAYILLRSIGVIALVVGGCVLLGAIVNVLDGVTKGKRKDAHTRTLNAKARKSVNPGKGSFEDRLGEWKIRLSEWIGCQPRYLLRYALFAVLAVLLRVYLYVLANEASFWGLHEIDLVWLGLLVGAWLLESIAGRLSTQIGLIICSLAVLVTAVVVPWVFIYRRAHDMAEDALRGTPVGPYFILSGSIPVLDVSSEKVAVEWLCTDKNKNRPSVFDGQPISQGELLGESPSRLFVRMDPPGKITIVELPTECVEVTRSEDAPAAKGTH